MNAVVEVRDVSKRFGERQALAGVDFTLAPGTTTVLLGTNGAGKSTLLRAILGLLAPDGGQVRVLGRDPLREPRAVRLATGYVPDQPDVYPWMRARDLFRFLGCQCGKGFEERAAALVERLRAPLDAPFSTMSRGEAAKVMLAAALAQEPRLLLLDEPCARLAPAAREEVLGVLLERMPPADGAVLLATHELDLAARVADRVLVLHEGRVTTDVPVSSWTAGAPQGRSPLSFLRGLYPQTADLESAR